MARENLSAAGEPDLGCLRMLRGREWAIAASLAPDPAAASADECEVCMDTWLAGRVRVSLRRASEPVSRQTSRNTAWRWQLVRATKIDDEAS